jgi:YhcG PDDEXK nuclease domain
MAACFTERHIIGCATEDLKSGELTHQDIGQMDMYVRMVDELKRAPDDNPSVGIILRTHKDASVVRYSVLHENEQFVCQQVQTRFALRGRVASRTRPRTRLACGSKEIGSSLTWVTCATRCLV